MPRGGEADGASCCGAPGETGNRVARKEQPSRLAGLIGRIHEAAADPGGWTAVLAELSEELGFAAAMLVARDRHGGSCRIEFAHGVEPKSPHGGEEAFAFPDPWPSRGQERTPVGAVVPGDTVLPLSDFQRTRFYRDVLRPRNVRRVLYAPIWRDGSSEVALLLGRNGRAGRYTSNELELCRLIVGQISRAWRLGRTRSDMHMVLNGALETLNRLSVGVALFGAEGQVLALNDAAQALIADVGNRTEHLWKLIADAARRGGTAKGTPFRALSLTRSADCRPISVLFCPISLSGDAPGYDREGTVAFLSIPERPSARHGEEFLREVYALTRAEARLAARVAQGRSINQIADDLAISVHTARTHLKRVFQKIGVDRQAELVQLLSTSVGFLRTPD